MTQEDPPAVQDYKPRRAVRRRSSRAPLVVLLVVVAALAVAGLFFLGLALPAAFGGSHAAAPSPTPTLTPTPTPTGPPTGPVPPGSYAWNELGGGECLTGYTSPWAEHFTVVACTSPHNAQLVRRGQLAGIPGAPYPGDAAITEQMTLNCTDPTVLDTDAAGKYTWMQWQAAYPPTIDDWNSGDRAYYCFFSRSSGENLTTSIVKAK